MKNKEYWSLWIKKAGVRAVKTFAEAVLGVIGSSLYLGDVEWRLALSAGVVASIVSLLISVKGLPEVELPETEN